MNQTMDSTLEKSAVAQSKGAVVLIGGVVLAVATTVLGYSIESELQTQGIKVLIDKGDPVIGLVFLFSFGLPLGIAALLAGAMLIGQERWPKIAAFGLVAALLIVFPPVVPEVFGRETGGAYFGVGGVFIFAGIAVSFWYWGRYRSTLTVAAKQAADMKALGYLCFALAAWGTCGLASMPSFGLNPQTMLDQGVRPFAVGQAKTIMAYFALGWWFTAAGLYKSVHGDNQKEGRLE